MSHGRLALGAVLGALLATACGERGAPTRTSVLLITLDTTRVDALGCYGQSPSPTPHLDRLAAEGVTFDAAQTVTPLTLPSHASMLTGLTPLRHGVRDNGIAAVPPSAYTVVEAAQEAGYRTGAFLASVVLGQAFGLSQGFDVYDVPHPGKLDAHGRAERSAAEVVDAALGWLATRDENRPFFLWVHFYDPHFPYAPGAPFRGNPYLGEVAEMDAEIGRLLERLRADGTLDGTFVLAVADHGEAFGEHGEVTHGSYTWQTTMHVPMIARFPDGARAGERVSELASVVDVHATLASVMGVRVDPGDGLDLSRAAPPADRGLYFESYYGYFNHGWSPLAGWMDAGGKYLHSSEPQFFRWREDPRELTDLGRVPGTDLEPYRRHIADLADLPRLESSGAALDEGMLAGIQSLGYAALSGGEEALPHPLAASDLPSPQSRASMLARHARASELALRGDHDAAARIYEGILDENPGNFLALDELATQHLSAGRAGRAAEVLRELVRRGPQRGKHYHKLGLALERAGDEAGALDAYGRAVELTGGRPRYRQALLDLLDKLGRADEARVLRERYPEGESP